MPTDGPYSANNNNNHFWTVIHGGLVVKTSHLAAFYCGVCCEFNPHIDNIFCNSKSLFSSSVFVSCMFVNSSTKKEY